MTLKGKSSRFVTFDQNNTVYLLNKNDVSSIIISEARIDVSMSNGETFSFPNTSVTIDAAHKLTLD